MKIIILYFTFWNGAQCLSLWRLKRRDLEVSGRIVGLLTTVQLCLFSRLTKEGCIATYLFARWVCDTRKHMEHFTFQKSVRRSFTAVLWK